MLKFTALSATSAAQVYTAPLALQAATPLASVRFNGTFGGATATLATRAPDETADGDWITHTAETATTAPAQGCVYIPNGFSVKVVIAGATGSTSINCRID